MMFNPKESRKEEGWGGGKRTSRNLSPRRQKPLMYRRGRVGRMNTTEHPAFSRHPKCFLGAILSNLKFGSWRWALLPSKPFRLPSGCPRGWAAVEEGACSGACPRLRSPVSYKSTWGPQTPPLMDGL